MPYIKKHNTRFIDTLFYNTVYFESAKSVRLWILNAAMAVDSAALSRRQTFAQFSRFADVHNYRDWYTHKQECHYGNGREIIDLTSVGTRVLGARVFQIDNLFLGFEELFIFACRLNFILFICNQFVVCVDIFFN